MRFLMDTVAGTWGFAVAPIERLAVSLNDLMQLRVSRLLHEKIRLFEKGPTAFGRRQNESPEPILQPDSNANLQVLHSNQSRLAPMLVSIAAVSRGERSIKPGSSSVFVPVSPLRPKCTKHGKIAYTGRL